MAATLMLLVAGCMSVDQAAVCDGLRALRVQHAAALAADGGDRSVITGARLIASLDAGCRDR